LRETVHLTASWARVNCARLRRDITQLRGALDRYSTSHPYRLMAAPRQPH
jgi:hypothetical protein